MNSDEAAYAQWLSLFVNSSDAAGSLEDKDKAILLDPADALQPFCPYMALLERFGLLCTYIQVVSGMFINSPPDFESITREAHAYNPLGVLPEPLLDMRGRLPEVIDPKQVGEHRLCGAFNCLPTTPSLHIRKCMPTTPTYVRAQVREEKATYAFYHRHIHNMYRYTFRYADSTQGRGFPHDFPRPLVPPGFT